MSLKLTIEPTGRFENFEGLRCRIWRGTTDGGVPVELFVPCIRSLKDADQTEFLDALTQIEVERELVSFNTRLL